MAGAGSRSLTSDASRLWYPLWDAGFVLGHSTRTVKEALALADEDLDALTALLDTRIVVGSGELVHDLVAKVHALAPKRRGRLVEALAAGAATRLERPGAIAEMLAPNLKDGGGGLRDVQAPGLGGMGARPGRRVGARPRRPRARGGARAGRSASTHWSPRATCATATPSACVRRATCSSTRASPSTA